jgi:hypothetical protein
LEVNPISFFFGKPIEPSYGEGHLFSSSLRIRGFLFAPLKKIRGAK